MTNDTTTVPAAACPRCGGWTSYGGMSQHSHNLTERVLGRTGCLCGARNQAQAVVAQAKARLAYLEGPECHELFLTGRVMNPWVAEDAARMTIAKAEATLTALLTD